MIHITRIKFSEMGSQACWMPHLDIQIIIRVFIRIRVGF